MKNKYVKYSTIAMALAMVAPVAIPSATALAGNQNIISEVVVADGETTKTFKVESKDGVLTKNAKFEVKVPNGDTKAPTNWIVKVNGEEVTGVKAEQDSETPDKYIVTLPEGTSVKNGDVVTVDFNYGVEGNESADADVEADKDEVAADEADTPDVASFGEVKGKSEVKVTPSSQSSTTPFKQNGVTVAPGGVLTQRDTYTVRTPQGKRADNLAFNVELPEGAANLTDDNIWKVEINGVFAGFAQATENRGIYTVKLKDDSQTVTNGDKISLTYKYNVEDTIGKFTTTTNTFFAEFTDDGSELIGDTTSRARFSISNRRLEFNNAPIQVSFGYQDYHLNTEYSNPKDIYYPDDYDDSVTLHAKGLGLNYGSDGSYAPTDWTITAAMKGENSLTRHGSLYFVYDRSNLNKRVEIPASGAPATIVDGSSVDLYEGQNNLFENLSFTYVTDGEPLSVSDYLLGQMQWTLTSGPLD